MSFVSVMQQFNTSNSMGRLTLNILLSFAQFEREIIAERTSDKMSAARRKGKWTGGMPMLGYDVDPKGGRLIVNEAEASQVREIFDLYLQHQSLIALAQELNRRGWTTKSWVTKDGKRREGKPFDKANLRRILSNPIYVGKVDHAGNIYEGEHETIIDEKTEFLNSKNFYQPFSNCRLVRFKDEKTDLVREKIVQPGPDDLKIIQQTGFGRLLDQQGFQRTTPEI